VAISSNDQAVPNSTNYKKKMTRFYPPGFSCRWFCQFETYCSKWAMEKSRLFWGYEGSLPIVIGFMKYPHGSMGQFPSSEPTRNFRSWKETGGLPRVPSPFEGVNRFSLSYQDHRQGRARGSAALLQSSPSPGGEFFRPSVLLGFRWRLYAFEFIYYIDSYKRQGCRMQHVQDK